ncbi:MAG: ribonuclease P protein subunit [Candidatus Diapherotrites archaeon]|uniref:Ribonuclease P protein component 1 n=1 Tax=Candidatus Iainarchaeum sp. TaxID=3101447 RepID=A0A8T4C5Z6_9ARCH|nr:ribonuclease P protein subunit [Candidatus Diapherotrites archaeon]
MIKTNHYTLNREVLPIHELIGLTMRVVESVDASKKGLIGKIINETQRTFVIDMNNMEKTLPKNESTFAFDLDGEVVEIEGSELVGNPIERLKNGGKYYA